MPAPRREPAPGFGALLARHRESRGLTKSELARQTGLNQGFISRLESGDRNPERATVTRLADALGLYTDDRDELFAIAGFWPDNLPVVPRELVRYRWLITDDQDEKRRLWRALERLEAA